MAKTKVRNAMGRGPQTVATLARTTRLPEGAVLGALGELLADSYTESETMANGDRGFRRARMNGKGRGQM